MPRWTTALFLLTAVSAVAQDAPPPAPAPDAVPATAPAAPGPPPETVTGPLRAELTGMAETRRWFRDPPKTGGESEVMLQMRLCGDRLSDVARAGRPLFDVAVDEAGHSMLRPEGYTDREKTETFRIRSSPESLRERGLTMSARLLAASRGAKTATLRGSMRIIRAAGPSEDVVIESPAVFRGKRVEHPRLAGLDIEIDIVSNDKVPTIPPGQFALAVLMGKNMERVKGLEFHDPWLTRLRMNPRNMQTSDGETVAVYTFPDPATLENSLMVVEVWPQVEDFQLPIELKDIPLP
ncbi:MAG: hypothetical protein HRU75_10460 [Planctomycetia bacterium]|nr:MAG: hypothetical protein HRU75_10460 [Planctomycetia bacterium]